MSLREILADIHSLEEDLLTFERKYGIRSETFYAAYMSGEEPEDETGFSTLENGPASIAPGLPDKPSTGMRFNGCSAMRQA